MRNESKPLDLQWKTWGLGMRNHLNPLDLQWKTLDFGMRNHLNPLELHWTSWDLVWESSWVHWICIENHDILHEKPMQTIRFKMEIMRFGTQDGFHNIWAAISWSDWDWTYISHQPWVLSWWSWSHWWSLQWAWCIFYGRWSKWGSSWRWAMKASEHCSSLHWGPSRITWVGLHPHHQLLAICLLGSMSMWMRTWCWRLKK